MSEIYNVNGLPKYSLLPFVPESEVNGQRLYILIFDQDVNSVGVVDFNDLQTASFSFNLKFVN